MSLYFDDIFEFMKSVASLKREEIANAITHGIGALLAIAALVLLIVFSALQGSAWHVSSFTIFGSTMVVLYVMSTLYHSLTHIRAKKLFRKFDHMSIFLLIAGHLHTILFDYVKGLAWLDNLWNRLGLCNRWYCTQSFPHRQRRVDFHNTLHYYGMDYHFFYKACI